MFVVLCLFWIIPESFGQGKELQRANRRDCSFGPQTNWVVFTDSRLVFTVTLDNFSGSDVYLICRESTTKSADGTTNAVSTVKVINGTTGGFDWGPAGCPFDTLNIAASATPHRLTNLTVNVGVMTVTSRKDP